MSATARLIAGNRLHLQHGPIDLVIGADGDVADMEKSYVAAAKTFPGILPGLVAELPLLRLRVTDLALSPASSGERAEAGLFAGRGRGAATCSSPLPHGAKPDVATTRQAAAPLASPLPRRCGGEGTHPIARRMYAAVWPYRDRFITPMAAVAGSVADHVLGVMLAAAPLRRAYVNNGGDIALHLMPGESFAVGVVGDLAAPGIDARVVIRAGDGIGGIATSGWRGRSQSLGIADAVTVLACDAATADAAATMIANAVDVEDPAIERRPARAVKDDSDLGDLPVTVAVGRLSLAARGRALATGGARAQEILGQKHIIAAYIQLQGEMVVVGESRPIAEAA